MDIYQRHCKQTSTESAKFTSEYLTKDYTITQIELPWKNKLMIKCDANLGDNYFEYELVGRGLINSFVKNLKASSIDELIGKEVLGWQAPNSARINGITPLINYSIAGPNKTTHTMAIQDRWAAFWRGETINKKN